MADKSWVRLLVHVFAAQPCRVCLRKELNPNAKACSPRCISRWRNLARSSDDVGSVCVGVEMGSKWGRNGVEMGSKWRIINTPLRFYCDHWSPGALRTLVHLIHDFSGALFSVSVFFFFFAARHFVSSPSEHILCSTAGVSGLNACGGAGSSEAVASGTLIETHCLR